MITEQNAGLNMIGALALKIHDLQMDAAVAASGLSPANCACLIGVAHQDTEQTISDIAAICQLSHSATVRLVLRLESLGYIYKTTSRPDRREVCVSLTEDGYMMRDKILNARRAAIEPVFLKVSASERNLIEQTAGKILSEITESRLQSEQICRFCDAVACGGNDCPVEKKALSLEVNRDR